MENEIIFAGDVIKIIDESKKNALKKVNEELIQMYWKVGEYLNRASENVNFGDAFIDTISKEFRQPSRGLRVLTGVGCIEWKSFMKLIMAMNLCQHC